MKIEHLPSKIPGWYDSSYLEEHGIQPESGAYIRSQVQVSTKNLSDQLQSEEDRLRKLYGDCRYYVVPKVEAGSSAEIELSSVSDDENIARYVAYAMPSTARFPARRVVNYLKSKLGRSHGHPDAIGGRFIRLRGTNVTSYESVDIRYDRQGLVLLKGVNDDWGGQSNGSGKTNLLNMISIALFGETGKGQKDDKWASEFTDERAGIELVYETGDKKRVNVARSRRPHSIHLAVNGKDRSSGLTGKRKTETQGSIERATGYDVDLLRNSVFIDQTITNGFVFGTQKARMDLIHKICNMERFEAAMKSVSGDLAAKIKERDRGRDQLENLKEELASVAWPEKEEPADWQAIFSTAKEEFARLKEMQSGLVGSKKFYDQMQIDADDIAAELLDATTQLSASQGKLEYWQTEARTANKLYEAGKCSLCGQPTAKVAKDRREKAEKQCEAFEKSVLRRTQEIRTLKKKRSELDGKIDHYEKEVSEVDQRVDKAEGLLSQARKGAAEEEERNRQRRIERKQLEESTAKTKRIITACKDNLAQTDLDIEMLTFAQKAMSRSGMPMYLAAGLVPLLNKSAQEYGEIFNGGKLSVRFDVIDGEFQVEIYNPAGSSTAAGQSVGEAAMAGIVAAFALRDVMPKSNLLIIDEPGSGLDEIGAKQFAEGLLKIKDRWSCVIVTTHNSVIGNILEEEAQVWTVRKRKRRSRLEIG